MIKLENITKKFGEKVIFRDVSFGADGGSLVVLTGKSGIGKTTFFTLLAGLLPLDKGEYWFDSQLLNTTDDEAMSQFRNTNVGYVVQDFVLIEDYTVLENLVLPSLYSRSVSKEEILIRARAWLARFQLTDLLDTQVKRLSGGQKQRIAIIRSLLLDPCLILADEPTAHLDKETAQFVLSIFQEECQKGKLVLIATHDEEIVNIADTVYVLDQQKVVEQADRSPDL